VPFASIRALTLDLDDTLWPIAPVIARAEQAMGTWLAAHAPATAALTAGGLALRRLRAEVEREHPELAHDLSALRLHTLRRAVASAGEPAPLADQAFEVFFAARQEVEFYPEVLEALERLAARYPLLSVSNGNADLHRVGVGRHFLGALSARDVGVAKPHPRVFEQACLRLGVEPARVLHVGDDLAMDVRGARAAGLAAAWVRRRGSAADRAAAEAQALPGWEAPEPEVHVVSDLAELADRLGC
jgi:putative hydrolase of the HAD superfamily